MNYIRTALLNTLVICFIVGIHPTANGGMFYKEALEYSKPYRNELRPDNLTIRDGVNPAYDEKVLNIYGELGEIKHFRKDNMTQFKPLFNFGFKAQNEASYQIIWVAAIEEGLLGQVLPTAFDIHFVNGKTYTLPVGKYQEKQMQGIGWTRIYTFEGTLTLKKYQVYELSQLGDVDYVNIRGNGVSDWIRAVIYKTDDKQTKRLTHSFKHGLTILGITKTEALAEKEKAEQENKELLKVELEKEIQEDQMNLKIKQQLLDELK